ncbi:MAG TPA: deoxyribodipyrimidine photo-lyase [Bryobacteraceae bacterium]|jgi:deoxyribodipyrimidine photo-lyase|nr:deoxyribodipyrimidine photo-lyase [Bryobacteraceae bacterium]
MPAEPARLRPLNTAPPRADGRYVLYWSQMNRRVDFNHALAHAAELANENGLPLLVYEGLTCTYKAANDRLHTFILQAVPETAKKLKAIGVGYFFYLRKRRADPNDLLYRLAANAFSVVTDDYPVFIAAAHNSSVPEKIGVEFTAVDSSCIVPMSRHEKRAWAAYTIRPKIRRELPQWLKPVAVPKPARAWRDNLLSPDLLALRTDVAEPDIPNLVAACEIDHTIPPARAFIGGYPEARQRLDRFLEHRLHRYAKESNQPSRHATSDLSPYLHFGQISSLEIALAVKDYAEEHRLIPDDFLEELIVRRELAFNFARFTPNVESLDVLPDWCKRTLAKHAADPRPFLYTPEQFERAETHDALWNACQKELLLRGKIHGYYRMYWGKKIIEWSPSYKDALREMIRLHGIYALDGRDPNTYANILWCFGLHDRPWVERPVFGQLRYMSLEGMRRKTDTVAYMKEIEGLA